MLEAILHGGSKTHDQPTAILLTNTPPTHTQITHEWYISHHDNQCIMKEN